VRCLRARSFTKRYSLPWRSPRRAAGLSILRSAPPWRCAASIASIAAAVSFEALPRVAVRQCVVQRIEQPIEMCASIPIARPLPCFARSCSILGPLPRAWRSIWLRSSFVPSLTSRSMREEISTSAGTTRRAAHGRLEFATRAFPAPCSIFFAFQVVPSAPRAITSAGALPKPKPAAITSSIPVWPLRNVRTVRKVG
jgi:hypothetical protein